MAQQLQTQQQMRNIHSQIHEPIYVGYSPDNSTIYGTSSRRGTPNQGSFNGKKVPESTYESVMTFFFVYIITFASSALLLSFSGIDFLTCISAAASAISNVGPGLGEIIGSTFISSLGEGGWGVCTHTRKIFPVHIRNNKRHQ